MLKFVARNVDVEIDDTTNGSINFAFTENTPDDGFVAGEGNPENTYGLFVEFHKQTDGGLEKISEEYIPIVSNTKADVLKVIDYLAERKVTPTDLVYVLNDIAGECEYIIGC